ncbi:MAG: CDP-alcohol phosphatidyltransferase family protein, partial [Chloroflexota bacterium]|nr:CDP-alcohol phosphatidyltransferase family protein [Chloroflexota bacterium]
MANLITVGRLIALFLIMALVYWGTAGTVAITMVGLALVIASDGIDGWVARRRNATSTFGAVFDIAGDRIVETVCWVVFADLGAVPIWVP